MFYQMAVEIKIFNKIQNRSLCKKNASGIFSSTNSQRNLLCFNDEDITCLSHMREKGMVKFMNNEERLKFLQEYISSDNLQKHNLVLETCKQNLYLYRYRPMQEIHDFRALFGNKFWIQSANNQNDELEGISFLTSFDVINLKIAKVIPKHLKAIEITKHNKRMINELKEFRQNFGIV